MYQRGQNPQRESLFQNRWLEALTVISVRWFAAIWCVALCLIVWFGWGTASPLVAIGLVLAGFTVWGCFEYVAHRYFFHWKVQWEPARSVVYVLHGNHHVTPNDPLRNLMPPIISFPISASVWAGCAALIGAAGTWLFLGYILGYIIYDMTHYACHQWPMRGALGQLLKRHHMRHHHISENGNYAISVIFLDRLLGSRI